MTKYVAKTKNFEGVFGYFEGQKGNYEGTSRECPLEVLTHSHQGFAGILRQLRGCFGRTYREGGGKKLWITL